MASSISNFVNHIVEGIHKIKFKYEHYYKKWKICGIKHKDCNCFLQHQNFKDK